MSHLEQSPPVDLSGYEMNQQRPVAPMFVPTAGTAKRSLIHSTNHPRALWKWEAMSEELETQQATHRERRSLL